MRFLLALLLASSLSPITPGNSARSPEWVQPGSGSRSPFINVRAAPYFAVGDGVADDTAAIQAALNAAGAGTAKKIFFPQGTYNHTGLTAAANTIEIEGAGKATLNFTGGASTDAVLITPAASSNGNGIIIRNMRFVGGTKAALHIQGSTANTSGGFTYSNVLIEGNTFDSATLSTLWLTHVHQARVIGNYVTNGGDNGIYAEYSDQVAIESNNLINCKGSGAIVAGYSDGTIAASGNNIVGNIIRADSTAVAQYTAGIDVVFSSNTTVAGNLIDNSSAWPNGFGYKTGIVIEEFTISRVQVTSNQVIQPIERAMRIGTNANSVVTQVTVQGNRFIGPGDGGGLDAIQVFRVDNLLVTDNDIGGFGQNGINASDNTTSDLKIVNNTIRDVGTQETSGGALGAIKSAADRTDVFGNTFIIGENGGVLTSAAANTSATIDTNASPPTLVLKYNSGANVAATINLPSTLTWGTLATTITAVALPTPGNYTLTLLGGSSSQSVRPIRRTGSRHSNDVAGQSITTAGIFIGTPEPYTLGTFTGASARVYGNRFSLPKIWTVPQPFAQLSSNAKWIGATEIDTTSLGSRPQYSSAAPVSTSTLYYQGDIVWNTAPTVGANVAWVNTTSGSPGTWTPLYAGNAAGTITLTSATPSTGTATVPSGAKCVCTNQTTQANPIKCSVTTTTLTATGPNTVTDVVTYLCF